MKKIAAVMLGLALIAGSVSVFGDEATGQTKKAKKARKAKKTDTTSTEKKS